MPLRTAAPAGSPLSELEFLTSLPEEVKRARSPAPRSPLRL